MNLIINLIIALQPLEAEMVLAQEVRKHQSSVGSSWLGCPGSNVQRELKVIGNCD